jgi:hypothetical protein
MIANRDAQIMISELVHSGTVLKLPQSQYQVESALIGPVLASLDKATGEINLSSEIEEEEESA